MGHISSRLTGSSTKRSGGHGWRFPALWRRLANHSLSHRPKPNPTSSGSSCVCRVASSTRKWKSRKLASSRGLARSSMTGTTRIARSLKSSTRRRAFCRLTSLCSAEAAHVVSGPLWAARRISLTERIGVCAARCATGRCCGGRH